MRQGGRKNTNVLNQRHSAIVKCKSDLPRVTRSPALLRDRRPSTSRQGARFRGRDSWGCQRRRASAGNGRRRSGGRVFVYEMAIRSANCSSWPSFREGQTASATTGTSPVYAACRERRDAALSARGRIRRGHDLLSWAIPSEVSAVWSMMETEGESKWPSRKQPRSQPRKRQPRSQQPRKR